MKHLLPIGGFTDAPYVPGVNMERAFALHIEKDSLTDAGINIGDLVLCEFSRQVAQGSLAIVETPDGYHLKYFYVLDDGRAKLEPVEDECETREYEREDVRVIARVVTPLIILNASEWPEIIGD
jgi:SOS-response transcriptional repressor LexA